MVVRAHLKPSRVQATILKRADGERRQRSQVEGLDKDDRRFPRSIISVDAYQWMKRRLSQIRKEGVERLARHQHPMKVGDREDPLLSSN